MMRQGGLALAASAALFAIAGCNWQLQPSCAIDAGTRDHAGPGAGPEAADAAKPEAAACPGPARTGDSPCFFHDCSAGMYCDDVGTPDCRPGCASDEDCGPRDTCVREGAGAGPLGRCEPCGRHVAHAAAPGCVVSSRSGHSRCFGGDCGPGQYCDDSAGSSCVPGCASDENCGPTESCERAPGASIGVCRSCYFDG